MFIKGKNGVSFIAARHYTGEGTPFDLSNENEWISGSSSVDMFVDFLRRQKDGVITRERLPNDNSLSLNFSPTRVQLEETPVLV